jgi:hypothetical protein
LGQETAVGDAMQMWVPRVSLGVCGDLQHGQACDDVAFPEFPTPETTEGRVEMPNLIS